MHFKTDHTLFSSMSNQEFLLTKDDKDLSNFQIVKRSRTLELQSASTETLSSSCNISQYSESTKEEKSNQEIEEYHQICRVRVPKQGDSESNTSKLKEEDGEEEDGFRTPTSLDHKISEPSSCPPAPRKTKPCLKRKASYYNNICNCRHPLDVSKEVLEFLFPTQHAIPLSASQQSTKKVRRKEHNISRLVLTPNKEIFEFIQKKTTVSACITHNWSKTLILPSGLHLEKLSSDSKKIEGAETVANNAGNLNDYVLPLACSEFDWTEISEGCESFSTLPSRGKLYKRKLVVLADDDEIEIFTMCKVLITLSVWNDNISANELVQIPIAWGHFNFSFGLTPKRTCKDYRGSFSKVSSQSNFCGELYEVPIALAYEVAVQKERRFRVHLDKAGEGTNSNIRISSGNLNEEQFLWAVWEKHWCLK
ncbi:hypothetical protein VNO78_15869 [Psophocarpus tetragonolobus]|uniref:Uncharacterized protein n=1 Tax=Psophocarpus tetragonolobus TaxID=3891 RepID=A0AAN9SJV6_PSOTE